MNATIFRPSDILSGSELQTYYPPFSKEQLALAERAREVEYEFEMALSEMFPEDDAS